MKLENNWRHKTLENLEKEEWGAPEFDSHLVRRCPELRQIPISTFTIEDLRIMIGQQFSLDYLIPLALDVLDEDLFVEGDFFEGDLLKNVLAIRTTFWDNNKVYWQTLHDLIKGRLKELEEKEIDSDDFYDGKQRVL